MIISILLICWVSVLVIRTLIICGICVLVVRRVGVLVVGRICILLVAGVGVLLVAGGYFDIGGIGFFLQSLLFLGGEWLLVKEEWDECVGCLS